jgi:hypothetical protein
MGKKSNKRTQPSDAESSMPLPVSVAWAKTRWMQRFVWVSGSNMVYSSRRCVDLGPLKQFAPVIHGNRKGHGRIAMGFPPPVRVVYSIKRYPHKIVFIRSKKPIILSFFQGVLCQP